MVPDPKASGIDEDGDPVLIDQDELLEREAYELNWCGLLGDNQYDPNDEEFSPATANRNHWIETKGYWIYWKAKPTNGIIHPNGHILNKAGSTSPTTMTELEGERITRAFFTNQTFPEIAIDNFFGGKHSLNMESDLIRRIVEESWYGATIFKKYSPTPTGYTTGGASASSTPAPNTTTADAHASPATASAAGAVVKRTIQTRQRLSVNLVKQRLKAAPMSDACTPCIQEHDDWVKASLDLERQ